VEPNKKERSIVLGLEEQTHVAHNNWEEKKTLSYKRKGCITHKVSRYGTVFGVLE